MILLSVILAGLKGTKWGTHTKMINKLLKLQQRLARLNRDWKKNLHVTLTNVGKF